MPERARCEAKAKVPALRKRSTCTLSDLKGLRAVMEGLCLPSAERVMSGKTRDSRAPQGQPQELRQRDARDFSRARLHENRNIIVMKAYKGFSKLPDGTLMCRDFEYKPGEKYTIEEDVLICEKGFHACHELWQVWGYYPNDGNNVFYEVECGGQIMEDYTKNSGKFVCSEITLLKEIDMSDIPCFNVVSLCGTKALEIYDSSTKTHKIIDKKGKTLLVLEYEDILREFHNGFCIISRNGQKNFINKDGEYLMNETFDVLYNFEEGMAIVGKNDKFNMIDTGGNIISSRWFDYMDSFHEGLAKFMLFKKDGKPVVSFIDKEGNMPIKKWFDDAGYFSDGFCSVTVGGKKNFIDKNGNLLSETWFEDVYAFVNGFASVTNDCGKMNYIKPDGSFLLDEWVDDTISFFENNEISIIRKDKSCYIIDNTGKVRTKTPYSLIYICDEVCIARKRDEKHEDKYCLLTFDGTPVVNEWFDSVCAPLDNDCCDFFIVEKDGKYNFLSKGGRILSDTWYSHAAHFSGDYALVSSNGKYNYIDKKGKYLSEQWFDETTNFVCKQFAYVTNGNKIYWIDNQGKLHFLRDKDVKNNKSKNI